MDIKSELMSVLFGGDEIVKSWNSIRISHTRKEGNVKVVEITHISCLFVRVYLDHFVFCEHYQSSKGISATRPSFCSLETLRS